MKALVTGGNGFIGSNLVDELVNGDWDVHTVDNLSATAHESFYFNDRSTSHDFSISNEEKLKKLFKDNKFDVVYHLAAESRIQPTLKNPPKACEINCVGTCSVLQRALETGVKRVVYSSTSSVYGLRNEPPLREDMPADCLNPYSVSKYAGEMLCKMYHELFDLETVVFRYFNVYGPREPVRGVYAPVIGRFLKQYKSGEDLTVVGDGQQTRDYTHVKDVVAANLLAGATTNDEVFGEVFNVGMGKSFSVLDLVHMIGSGHTFVDRRPGEARHTCADISKTQESLGWDPSENLEDYIKNKLTVA